MTFAWTAAGEEMRASAPRAPGSPRRQMDMLNTLKALGCPMGTGATAAAVRSGQLPVLRWLRRNGPCPWDTATEELADTKLGYTDFFGKGMIDAIDENAERVVKELLTYHENGDIKGMRLHLDDIGTPELKA